MSIKKDLLLEFSLICGFLLFFYLTPSDPDSLKQTTSDEIRCLFINSGPGQIIGTFGILWGIGGFVRIISGWGHGLVSIAMGVGLFLFGHVLETFGFFCSMLTLGLFMLVIAWMMLPMLDIWDLRRGYKRLVIIAAVISLIGWVGKGSDTPIEAPYANESHEAFCDRIGDHPDARWRIRLKYYGAKADQFFAFTGTSAEANAQAELLSTKNNISMDYVVLTLLNIPPAHARSVGAIDWISSRKWEDY